MKTIKSGKISDLGSKISEKQSIVYTSTCIEEARIGGTLSHTDSKDGSHSHSWNYEDHTFDYKLDQWGIEKLFHNSDEVLIIELKLYIEDWGKLNIKNKSKLSYTIFLANYGSLALYDEYLEKGFIIDHENYNLKILDGLYLEYLRNLMGLCLIKSIFAFRMIYLIKLNQLIKIKISCLFR